MPTTTPTTQTTGSSYHNHRRRPPPPSPLEIQTPPPTTTNEHHHHDDDKDFLLEPLLLSEQTDEDGYERCDYDDQIETGLGRKRVVVDSSSSSCRSRNSNRSGDPRNQNRFHPKNFRDGDDMNDNDDDEDDGGAGRYFLNDSDNDDHNNDNHTVEDLSPSTTTTTIPFHYHIDRKLMWDDSSHWKVLTQMYGSVWPRVIPYCLWNVFVTALLSYGKQQQQHHSHPAWDWTVHPSGHQYVATFMSLLLVTRVTIILNRYMENSQHLTQLLRSCRELVATACHITSDFTSSFSSSSASSSSSSSTTITTAGRGAKQWRQDVAFGALVLVRVTIAILQFRTKVNSNNNDDNPWQLPEVALEYEQDSLRYSFHQQARRDSIRLKRCAAAAKQQPSPKLVNKRPHLSKSKSVSLSSQQQRTATRTPPPPLNNKKQQLSSVEPQPPERANPVQQQKQSPKSNPNEEELSKSTTRAAAASDSPILLQRLSRDEFPFDDPLTATTATTTAADGDDDATTTTTTVSSRRLQSNTTNDDNNNEAHMPRYEDPLLLASLPFCSGNIVNDDTNNNGVVDDNDHHHLPAPSQATTVPTHHRRYPSLTIFWDPNINNNNNNNNNNYNNIEESEGGAATNDNLHPTMNDNNMNGTDNLTDHNHPTTVVERHDEENDLLFLKSQLAQLRDEDRQEMEELCRAPNILALNLRNDILKQRDGTWLTKTTSATSEPPLDLGQELKLLDLVGDMVTAMNDLFKLVTTPIPFPLVQMNKTFLYVWLFTIPLALAHESYGHSYNHHNNNGMLNCTASSVDDTTTTMTSTATTAAVTWHFPVFPMLLVFMITFGFLGLEFVSMELTDNFGSDPSDFDTLGLAHLCIEDCYWSIYEQDGLAWAHALRKRLMGQQSLPPSSPNITTT